MLFKLPDPPAGQVYVNKVTANGPVTVLVPKESLSEDICVETGRTWAEEARLYNINNAPDGKKIAEPGDPFYQTAESIKNKNKEIKGLGAKGLSLFNSLKGSAGPDTAPNLSVTMDKIKSGAIFSDITANLGKIGEVSGSLPGVSNAQLEAAKVDIAARMEQAKKDLPKLLAMTQARIDILTKRKVAETGKPPSEAEIKEASGALAIFQDGPKLLESKAAEISKDVAIAGKDFGASISKGLSSAKDFSKAGINKITDLAKLAGTKITEFANGVPSQTIPDPVNPGQTIPNPAYATFAANPANAAKIAKVSEITGKMNSAATDFTTKFTAIEAKGTAAATSTMADLKAFGFAAKLSQPVTGLAAQVQDFTLDPAGFSPAKLNQTFASVSKLGASINTARYKNTKDEDLTYTGDDGIVWDSVDTERQRRGLPGLAAIGSPRPADPPLVPAGPTPPKPADSPSKIERVKSLTPPPVVAAIIKKTRGVFDSKPDDKISEKFVQTYRGFFEALDASRKELENTEKRQAEIDKWFSGVPEYASTESKAKAIIKNKPDTATRTPEEKQIVDSWRWYLVQFIERSLYGARYNWVSKERNKASTQHNIVRDAFFQGKTYGELPNTVEEIVAAGNGPNDWTYFVKAPPNFKSFEDFAKQNPTIAKNPFA